YLFLFDIAIDFETVILPKSCASVFNLCSCSTTPACQRPALAPDSPSSGSGSLLLNKLSSFRPSTAVALHSGIFNSPDTFSLLRSEAADLRTLNTSTLT
ncbi:hypothetical protein AGABI1DRAFT_115819, partial [Agaricus bisporus var. burnettii JB137-S8]